MECKNCGQSGYLSGQPCPRCGYVDGIRPEEDPPQDVLSLKGHETETGSLSASQEPRKPVEPDTVEVPDPGQSELLSHLRFILAEIETWRDELPSQNFHQLQGKYRQQIAHLEVEMGLRPPPLDVEKARKVELMIGQLGALQKALPYWLRLGLLTDQQSADLHEDTAQEIKQLEELLVDAAPHPRLDIEILVLEKWRFLRTSLERLQAEGRLSPTIRTGRYEEAIRELDQGILAREELLATRSQGDRAQVTPARKAKARKPDRKEAPQPSLLVAPAPLAPARLPRPAKPARQPLTWDRVLSTLLSERSLQAILFMGCLLLFAAAVSLVIWNWETFSPELQLLFLVLFTLSFYGLGWFVRRRLKLRGSGLALTGVGSLLVPLDFYAIYLSGGFPQSILDEVWLAASVLCLVIYIGTAYHLQAPFFGYLVSVAAGSLAAAGMNIAGIPSAWWQSGLAGLGSGLALAAYLLARNQQSAALEPARRSWKVFEQPFWWAALFGSITLLALFTGRLLLSRELIPGYSSALAVSWWFGGITAALSTVRFKHGAFAGATALTFAAAVLISERAWFDYVPHPAAWYSTGLAVLAVIYILLARPRSGHLEFLRIRQFQKIFLKSGITIAILAAIGSMLDTNVMGLVHPWLALATAAITLLWRRPLLSLYTSLLLLTSAAAWLAWSGAALSQLGVAWALLSIFHIVAALWLKNRTPPDEASYYAAPVFLAGWLSAAIAILPPLVLLEQPALSYSLGNWILLNGWLALLAHAGENPALSSLFPHPGDENSSSAQADGTEINPLHGMDEQQHDRRRPSWHRVKLSSLYFHWSAALALLPWLWLMWGHGYARNDPDHRLALLYISAAFPLLLLAGRLQRAHRSYAQPWIMTAQLSALASMVLSILHYQQFEFTFTWLLASVFWFACAGRQRRSFLVYTAGVSYSIAWMNGLIWAGLDLNGYSLAMAGIAALFVLGGGWLSRRREHQPSLVSPLFLLAIAAGIISFGLGLYQLQENNASDLSLIWTAVGWFVLAADFGLYAWYRPDERNLAAHAAAWLGVSAGSLIAVAYSQGRGSSAFKASVLAAAYVLAERMLLAGKETNRFSGPARSFLLKAWALYRRPLIFAGWPVSAGAIFLALFVNLIVRGGGPVREAWSSGALMVVTGLYAAAASWYSSNPRSAQKFAWLAFLLLPFPWTLFYRLAGHYTLLWNPPDLPAHALPLAALAFLYGLLVITLTRKQPADQKWIKPASVTGHLLMPLSLLWGAGRSEVSVITFGLGLAFYSLAAWNGWRRSQATLFFYPAVWLVPGWIVYITIRLAPDAPQTVFGALVLSLALPALAMGVYLLRRRKAEFNRLAYPFFTGGWAMLAVGTVLVAHDTLALAWALLAAVVTSTVIAWLLSEPLWLYLASAALPGAILVAFKYWQVPGPRHGLGLIGLAAAYLLISWLLKRMVRSGKDWTEPLMAAAFALIAFGLVPASQERITAAAGYGAAALLYALTAGWLKQPLLFWPAVGLSGVPYWVMLLEMDRPVSEYGILIWPFIVVVLLLAHMIDRRFPAPQKGFSSNDLSQLPRSIIAHLTTCWSLPFFSAAYLLAGISMLPALNDPQSFPFTPLLAGVVYSFGVAYFRRPIWLLLAASVSQWAVLQILLWVGLNISPAPEPSWYALFFTPITLLTALAGLFLHQREQGQPGIWGWSGKLYLLMAIDVFVVQGFALQITAQARWITMAHTGLLFTLAAAWSWGWLTYGAAGLGLLAVVQHLLWIDQPLNLWAWTLALAGLGYGFVSYALKPYERPTRPASLEKRLASAWGYPLRQSAWLLSGWALLMALVSALDVGGYLVRILLDQPVLGPNNIAVIQSLVATLSICGLFFLAAAAGERWRRLGYAAIGLLLAAWSVEWLLIWNLREVQWYAIPAGVYLLGIGYLEWTHGGPPGLSLARWIDRAAIVLLLGSSFWQSLTAADGWPYALIMGAEGLLLAWWGSGRRLRRFLYAGVAGVTIDAVGQSIEPLLSNTNRWIVLLIAGLILVVVGTLVERRLEQIKLLSGELSKRLEDWQ